MPGNVRAFLAFRVLFNARFYYPVLAVLFVDLGLTLDQYAWLNVAWAGSIVLCELPLGALADRIGRRPLVVGAAWLMVMEMAVLAFALAGAALCDRTSGRRDCLLSREGGPCIWGMSSMAVLGCRSRRAAGRLGKSLRADARGPVWQ